MTDVAVCTVIAVTAHSGESSAARTPSRNGYQEGHEAHSKAKGRDAALKTKDKGHKQDTAHLNLNDSKEQLDVP